MKSDNSKDVVQSGNSEKLTYQSSGVDIGRAQKAKNRIRELARSTFNSGVVSEIGTFAGLYRPDLSNLQTPILLSTADGVGTKLKIASLSGIHNTVGIDIVAHCTNDLLVQGGFPLFFLDYIGMGKLEPEIVEQVITGLAEGCKQAQCALLGGETAEMPGFYQEGEYDLVGFMVGISDECSLFQTDQVETGDILIGLPSSGLHTNGYSLARKLFFEKEKLKIDSHVEELGKTVAEELLIPHRNYLPVIKDLIQDGNLHGIAHITGGGITDNLARVLPKHLDASIQNNTWEILPVFHYIQEHGHVNIEEMYKTFNMGLGLILVAPQSKAEQIQNFLLACDEKFYLIGEITDGSGKVLYL